MASNGEALSAKCVACHDTNFDKSALGKSAIVQGQSADQIYASLRGYKAGTQNKAGLGAMMKGQVSSYSDYDLRAVSEYIASLPKSEWPFACTQSEIKAMPWEFGTNKVVVASSNDSYPLIYVDKSGIEIDRKNKMIKAWTVSLASQKERASQIRQLGSKYDNYGYDLMFFLIDYSTMRYSIENMGELDCNRNIINSFKKPADRKQIKPHSTIDDIAKTIMKEYNLR